jgi:hypothetical protein
MLFAKYNKKYILLGFILAFRMNVGYISNQILGFTHFFPPAEAAYETSPTQRIHVDRVARRHCHYCDLDCTVGARCAKSARGSGANAVYQQLEATRAGGAQLP